MFIYLFVCFCVKHLFLRYYITKFLIYLFAVWFNHLFLCPCPENFFLRKWNVWLIFLFLPGIVGTLITGYLLEVFKSWDSVFNLNALVLVVGALAFLSLVTAKKIAWIYVENLVLQCEELFIRIYFSGAKQFVLFKPHSASGIKMIISWREGMPHCLL